MPFAPVNERGAHMFYEDSGVPSGSTTHITLVILHGGYFNSGVFRPLLPFAASNNLRLVLINGRDISKSTPFDEAELAAIQSKDPATQAKFMRSSVPEYANFVAWYIQHEKVVPFKEDSSGQKTGGLSLLGWSAGSQWFIPFFALADAIPEHTRNAIEPYLRSYVMYDPTYYTIGKPDPPVYCPLRDPALTPQEQANAFPAWVSGYYSKHAPLVRAALVAKTLKDLPSPDAFHGGLQRDHDTVEEGGLEPTLVRITKDTLDEISSMDGFVRSTLPVLFFDKAFYADCAHKFVFDEAWAKKYFPRARATLVANMKSHGDCLTCAYTMKEMLLKREAAGKGGRNIQVVPFDDVNHMPHWDDPEKTVKFFLTVI